jgi:two-component system response regulator AlgR
VPDPLRTLIVDDEPAAIRRLARLCEPLPDVTIVATASDGSAALAALDSTTFDLVFLDIEMPGMSGLALAERLAGRDPGPAIVFVTAFDRFAVQAFQLDAVGYLLKPVDPALLRATLDRIVRLRAAPAAPARDPAIFWAPYRGALVRLEAKDIDRITGEDDYVRLHCSDRSYLVAERLYAIEQRMAGDSFVRIHRSTLVNRDRIAALAFEGGSWVVRLSSGEHVTIGRSFLPMVRRVLNIEK